MASDDPADPSPELVERVAERLALVRDRIEAAGGGDSIKIVGVTKGHPIAAVRAGLAAGLVDLGENYAKELAEKAEAIASDSAPVRWHMIGQLQTNKVRTVVPHVAMVQTVDRTSLVTELGKRAPGLPVLVQVNLSGDPARGGCSWDEAADLVEAAAEAGLRPDGLMGVAPQAVDADVRAAFARLAALRDRLGLVELSIGMSGDLDIAVGEGATMVRIGTAVFGER